MARPVSSPKNPRSSLLATDAPWPRWSWITEANPWSASHPMKG